MYVLCPPPTYGRDDRLRVRSCKGACGHTNTVIDAVDAHTTRHSAPEKALCITNIIFRLAAARRAFTNVMLFAATLRDSTAWARSARLSADRIVYFYDDFMGLACEREKERERACVRACAFAAQWNDIIYVWRRGMGAIICVCVRVRERA